MAKFESRKSDHFYGSYSKFQKLTSRRIILNFGKVEKEQDIDEDSRQYLDWLEALGEDPNNDGCA